MAKRNATFHRVGALRPSRSAFDLSHRILTTTNMGLLYPITSFHVMAGDYFKIWNELVIRLQPMFAPLLHEINAYCHWFFVPFRILWELWEKYITGGRDGNFTASLPVIKSRYGLNPDNPVWSGPSFTEGSLMDALYHQTFGSPSAPVVWRGGGVDPVLGNSPIDFPLRAYNKIYNDYYRDPNLIDEVPLTYYAPFQVSTKGMHLRAWEKDYFTSSLPDQQRGTPPALPLSGFVDVENPGFYTFGSQPAGSTTMVQVSENGLGTSGSFTTARLEDWFNKLKVNVSDISTFDVSDLRLAVQIQKYLERSMRSGPRYTEWLRAHYGVSPRDERLDRAEYIGGSKSPVIISEVLQTSESDATPQANMAGHGITVDRTFIGKYHVQEPGIIMAIMSVMPRAMYIKGLEKEWIKRNKYEFPFPELAHLSEKAVESVEINYDRSSDTPGDDDVTYAHNTRIFGFQGQYDEFRYKASRIGGEFKSLLDYWHLARSFASRQFLNRSFIECHPDSTKRPFNSRVNDSLMVSFGAKVTAVRPLPNIAEPGLVDHF